MPTQVPKPVALHDVADLAAAADRVVHQFALQYKARLPVVEWHHIGATAMPFGHTKGDVDINLRVDSADFARVVDVLRAGCRVAQRSNWTESFASFACEGYELPLGIQVTVRRSKGDILLTVRDRLREDSDLLRRYDQCKVAAAPRGARKYWEAKDAFLRELLP